MYLLIAGPEFERLRGGKEQLQAGRNPLPALPYVLPGVHGRLGHSRKCEHGPGQRRSCPNLRYRQQRASHQSRRTDPQMRRLGLHDGRRRQR